MLFLNTAMIIFTLISFVGMIDRKIPILTYQHGGRRLKAW